MSEEAYAAFHGEPLTVVFPAVIEARLLQVDAETKYLPPDHLDAVQVEGMLAENGGSWTLAIRNDATTGVLGGELLTEVYERGGGVVELPLHSPTPAEHLVLADSAELYGPSASCSSRSGWRSSQPGARRDARGRRARRAGGRRVHGAGEAAAGG